MKKQPNTLRHPEQREGSLKETTQESGSIMLEVIAILAILAVITPIIYQQAYRRNIEISNVNIASEMRSVKEAVQAYINASCPSNMLNCTPPAGGVASFMPDGLEDALDSYAITFCSYHVGSMGNTECRPSLAELPIKPGDPPVATRRYALVIDNNPPSNWNLRRARRVATLVGTDAGVCMADTSITGVNGAWSLLPPNPCAVNNVVVHTGLNIWQ